MKKNAQVVGLDFDETLGLFSPKNNEDGYEPKRVNNVPNPRIVKLVKEMRSRGILVIVYSSRWWGDYNAVKAWLKKYKIIVDGIVLGRLKADLYICDKSVDAHSVTLERDCYSVLNDADKWGIHYDKYYPKKNKK